MKFQLTKREQTIDLLLDQNLAAQITDLGARLVQVQNNGMENNPQADRIAQHINELREKAKQYTLTLTLQSLSYSAWLAALSANPAANKNLGYDMLGVITTALPDMITHATYASESCDIDKQDISELVTELPDTLVNTLWQAITDLNAKSTDPKASFDLASTVLAN